MKKNVKKHIYKENVYLKQNSYQQHAENDVVLLSHEHTSKFGRNL